MGCLTNLDRAGQGPTVLAVGAGEGCFAIFCSRLSYLFPFSSSIKIYILSQKFKTDALVQIRLTLTRISILFHEVKWRKITRRCIHECCECWLVVLGLTAL